MAGRKIVVAGASGLVGHAATEHFEAQPDCEVVALSRRPPRRRGRATFLSVDLTDRARCAAQAEAWRDATHLVYAALHERPALVDGWRDPVQIATNAAMFANLLDAVLRVAPKLRHVTLLQGTKAYGVHVRPMKIPAREDRSEAYDLPNFYWEQERHLKARQAGQAWHWTILRPVLIFGEAVGGAMDLIPPLGVYGALLAADGRPLDYPGGAPRVGQAVDAGLLARAIDWAGTSAAARNQAFNVANGDVFTWPNVWPAIAEALGMQPGGRKPCALAEMLPARAADWRAIAEAHDLISADLEAFLGLSAQYADYCLEYGRERPGAPTIVSTVKIQQAGFHEVMDTEAMLRKWLRRAQKNRLLPPPRG